MEVFPPIQKQVVIDGFEMLVGARQQTKQNPNQSNGHTTNLLVKMGGLKSA